jgi:tRNA modification GTPase
MAEGARLAEPGEFTLRAFLNGRIDLTQAEAVADLIEAVTPLQARAAFDQLEGTLTRAIGELDAVLFDLIARLEASIDFPEEGYHFIEPDQVACAIETITARLSALLGEARRGRLIREGFTAAIVGKPNVGKSSVFNALVGASRAIVTDVPGTTRDLLTEAVDIEGFQVTLVDSAGLRPTADTVEREGVERARRAQMVAEIVVVVLDRSAPLDSSDREVLASTASRNRILVANKADLDANWADPDALHVSARTGEGMSELRRRLAVALDDGSFRDRPAITNVRHAALLEQALAALARARTAACSAEGALPEEFVLADLQQARAALEEITGRRAPDAMLEHIFSRFCVGK